MTLKLNGYNISSFTRKEREMAAHFATATIFHMQLLQSSIADANKAENERDSIAEIANKLSTDLEAAEARISEDQATIDIKDNQLKNAKAEIETLEKGWEKQKLMINDLNNELQSLKGPFECTTVLKD